MPRLFTGIEIPDDIKDALSDLEAPLPGVKWVALDDLHLTLQFAGDIDNRIAEEFAHFLAEIRPDPFELELAEVHSLPGKDPKVIVAGVKPNPALMLLQRAHETAARAAGLPPESRPFKPHVTLARVKYARIDAIARYLSHKGGFRAKPFTVDKFVLFAAKPGGGGPYLVEEEFPLGHQFEGAWSEGDDA